MERSGRPLQSVSRSLGAARLHPRRRVVGKSRASRGRRAGNRGDTTYGQLRTLKFSVASTRKPAVSPAFPYQPHSIVEGGLSELRETTAPPSCTALVMR